MPDQNSNSTIRSERYERVISAIRKFQDVRPSTPPIDPKCRLWYERVRCTRLTLLWPVFIAFTVLLDIGLDLEVALTHYEHGEHHWARGTIAIVVITEIFIQVASAFFFSEDTVNEDNDIKHALRENDLEVNPWAVCLSHLLFLGRFVRLYQTWKVAHNIRSEGYEDLEYNVETQRRFIRRHRLYLKQVLENNTLGLIEALFENAPQVLFQFYVLLGHGHVDLTSRDDLLVTLNIVKSLILFAFSHLSYARSRRKLDEESGQLPLFSKGAVSLYSWRLFMLVSRILVLALIYSTIDLVFSIIFTGLHFGLFLNILKICGCIEKENELTSKIFQAVFWLVFAYIYTLSYFPLGKKTKILCITYYCLIFVENSLVLVLWWLFLSNWGFTFKLIAVLAEKISFLVGLVCLVLYYRYFHPSIGQTTD